MSKNVQKKRLENIILQEELQNRVEKKSCPLLKPSKMKYRFYINEKKHTEKIKCEHSRKLSDFLSNSKTLEYYSK